MNSLPTALLSRWRFQNGAVLVAPQTGTGKPAKMRTAGAIGATPTLLAEWSVGDGIQHVTIVAKPTGTTLNVNEFAMIAVDPQSSSEADLWLKSTITDMLANMPDEKLDDQRWIYIPLDGTVINLSYGNPLSQGAGSAGQIYGRSANATTVNFIITGS